MLWRNVWVSLKFTLWLMRVPKPALAMSNSPMLTPMSMPMLSEIESEKLSDEESARPMDTEASPSLYSAS